MHCRNSEINNPRPSFTSDHTERTARLEKHRNPLSHNGYLVSDGIPWLWNMHPVKFSTVTIYVPPTGVAQSQNSFPSAKLPHRPFLVHWMRRNETNICLISVSLFLINPPVIMAAQ